MAKYTICTGMGQTPQGVQEFSKVVNAGGVVVHPDGTLEFFEGDAGISKLVAAFKNYMWCLDESQIPIVAAPVSRIGRQ